MIAKIEQLLKEVEALHASNAEELEALRIKYLSKKGAINDLMADFRNVAADQKKEVGMRLNELKTKAQDKINALKELFESQDNDCDGLDLTRSAYPVELGTRHPLTIVKNEIIDIFARLGFSIAEGPEIEDDWHVFSALNFAEDHPARDMQDTFFIEAHPDVVLRTHTSSVQTRVMETSQPPIRIICPGRVYRNEAISYRAHCFFHQVEALYVDKNVSFTDLKQVLLLFAKEMFGADTKIRLRPSYFPFTEPSAEMDISCNICGGKGCPFCKHTGWVEILGCGMVDPNVLESNGIDSKVYSGYALGMGIERITNLKYQVKDLRMFSEERLLNLDFTTEDAEDTEFLFQPYQLRFVFHRKSLERKNSVRLCVLCVLCGEINKFIMAKDRLITPSYCFILAANFLLYFGFWLLIPVLPFYLSEFFQTGNSTIGIVLSCYTVAALCIRPFSGYLLDTFARKPLYLFAYFIFMMMFGGYLIAGSLTLFIIFRIIHGVSFGMVTVGGNTVVIDIMPSSRRGEGLGYYGLTNNTAMSIGPMFGLFLHDAGVSFATIFCYAFGSCILGFLCASLVKTPYKPPVKREPSSLDRFILMKGLPAGFSLLLLSIPYGMTTNYVAMYARQIGLNTQTGFFFTFMAVGMAISRIFSGKLVDRGKITQVIIAGLYLVVCSFFLLSACVYLIQWSDTVCNILFFGIALLMGVGFGIMFPAFNTLFVNLAPNSQRGTATSTYLTSWDVGIGIGMLTGGYIAEISTFDKAYLFGACLTVVSALYFKLKVTPHYHKNKLR